MTFLEQFSNPNFDTEDEAMKQRVQDLLNRANPIPEEQVAPYGWMDPEILEEENIVIKPDWKEVQNPLAPADAEPLRIAAVVGESLDDDTDEISSDYRDFALIGHLPGAEENAFKVLGYISRLSARDEPLLRVANGKDDDQNIVPWESADAELFMQLAEQVFPAQA